MTIDNGARELAPQRLKAQRDLTSLLGATVLVSILAVAVWAFTGGGVFWPAWVMLGFVAVLAAGAWRAHARAGTALSRREPLRR